MRLIVVRHFKTYSNKAGKIIGWGDSPPADDWENDVIFVNKTLQDHQIEFDAIYTSQLERAINTARYFANCRNNLSLFHNGQLNEVNYGSLNQQNKSWVEEHIPAYKTDPYFVFPEGESFHQMHERVVHFVKGLEAGNEDKTLLLVSHAGVIRSLVCHFLNLNYASNLKRRISHRYIGNFLIENSHCIQYGELGESSEFISEKAITPLPHFLRAELKNQKAIKMSG